MIPQKGMHLNHDFYVVVGKHCCTKMHTRVTDTISLYKLTNALLLLICFKLVLSFYLTENFILKNQNKL